MDDATIVLIDIDGTLTEPRRKIGPTMIEVLIELSGVSHIGLVTGSPVSLIEEQLAPFFEQAPSSVTENIDLLPCNGTQHYYWDASENKIMLSSSVSMRNEIGETSFQKLLAEVQLGQLKFATKIAPIHNLPMCGNFVDYRGSLLNWCPIGRCADFDDRNLFIEADTQHNIRTGLKVGLELAMADVKGIVIKYGGQTSFDIFPTGWDKTFCLRHYNDPSVWFVGDSCTPGGNDYEIYEKYRSEGRSFITSSPAETVKIIRTKIIPQLEEFLFGAD